MIEFWFPAVFVVLVNVRDRFGEGSFNKNCNR